MKCSRCRKKFREEDARCPHCGEPNPETSGLFQTSTVLICSGGSDMVFRSVDEVPARLRSKLLKTTNSPNSATILIADRRGRKEIARAMRKLPWNAQRRLMHSVLGQEPGGGWQQWVTPRRKRIAAALIFMLALALIALVFTHHWQ
ncbi:MAG TPA: hypothetical protein VN736_30455 [Candidatus Limnocylindrales bacterium]|nr:hypothetical protein [Candidatus Limnocylindrales bacterium]